MVKIVSRSLKGPGYLYVFCCGTIMLSLNEKEYKTYLEAAFDEDEICHFLLLAFQSIFVGGMEDSLSYSAIHRRNFIFTVNLY